jgi:hypothetical protein
MSEVVYICTGGCGAVISKEQYDNGLTQCGADGCKNKGIEFEKRLKCSDCGFIYEETNTHNH